MKNLIVLALLVVMFVWAPLVSFASSVDIVNSLNSISGAINRNTEAIAQSRIDALDQDCVSLVKQEINTRDTYLKDVDQKIADTRSKINQVYDSSERSNLSSYLGYLYTLQKRQTQFYSGIVFDSCSGQYTQKTKQYLVNLGCQKKYGTNSLWSGNKNDDGTWRCDCAEGYQFNTNNQCVVEKTAPESVPVEFPITEQIKPTIKTNKDYGQMCRDNYGVKGIWTGELNDQNGPVCDCVKGYKMNTEEMTCNLVVKTVKSEPSKESLSVSDKKIERPVQDNGSTTIKMNDKKPSFWSRLKYLFGF